jgi:hypothetical protein
MLRTARQLAANSVVLEVNGSLGGRAATLARGNKNIIIHSIESFNEGSLKNEFDSVKPWIREQLFDICRDNNLDKKVGQELFDNLSSDFENDSSGRLAFNRIISKYDNVTLHDRSTPRFGNWTSPLDMIVINMRENPELNQNLSYWIDHLKSDGRVMAHLYNDATDVTNEIDNLIKQGWKILDKEDSMILIQKP